MSPDEQNLGARSMQFIQAKVDVAHYSLIRTTVKDFIATLAAQFDSEGITVLDVAPEAHAGAQASFTRGRIETIDIDPDSAATHIADLCVCNCARIPSALYDVIVCTEVLEHTKEPWKATKELHRFLKPGGVLAVTTPFNFRIHGPAPDCWRFTDEGLRVLLADFIDVRIDAVEDPQRPRMPIQYTVVARKGLGESETCWAFHR